MNRTLPALAALYLAGCTWTLEDYRFRTKQMDTAFDRAVQAVEQHCWGTRLVDRDRQLVFSKWQAWPTGEGVFLSRCMVSMVPDLEDKSDDVRLSFAMRKCPLADLDDVEKLAESCTPVFEVPSAVADQMQPAARKIVTEITR